MKKKCKYPQMFQRLIVNYENVNGMKVDYEKYVHIKIYAVEMTES